MQSRVKKAAPSIKNKANQIQSTYLAKILYLKDPSVYLKSRCTQLQKLSEID